MTGKWKAFAQLWVIVIGPHDIQWLMRNVWFFMPDNQAIFVLHHYALEKKCGLLLECTIVQSKS